MFKNLFSLPNYSAPTVPRVTGDVTPIEQVQAEALQLEKQRFFSRLRAFDTANPRAKLFFAGAGALFVLLGLETRWEKSKAEAEVEFRKSRLQQPVVKISDENGTSFPWDSRNVNDWLYRKVQVTGRFLHYKAMLIPSRSYGLDGFEYVVPLVTKETPNGDPIEGVLVNKGFIPEQFQHVASRYRIENSFLPETFVAYVSRLEEHSEHDLIGPGNSPVNLSRNKWSYADLEDMARTAGLQNQNFLKVAVLEKVVEGSPLDERNTQLRDVDSDYVKDYPYAKTHAGALHLNQMPWQLGQKAQNYFTYGIISSVVSAVLFFAK